jgi:hypothetical protein
MSDKQAIIKELLDMQRKFIEYERKNGLDPKDYFAPDEGHPLHGYRDSYMEKAIQVLDIAHTERGSKR